MRTSLLLSAVLLSFFALAQESESEAARVEVERHLNFSFEYSDDGQPANWTSSGWNAAPYKVYLTSAEAFEKRRSVEFRCTAEVCGSQETSAVVTKRLPADALVGKTVKLRGFLKTEAVEAGEAELWLRVDGAPAGDSAATLASADTTGRGATGTRDWTPYEVTLDVPEGAHALVFGARFAGRGSAWADALELSVIDETGAQTPAADALSLAQLETFQLPADLLAWLGENAVPLKTAVPTDDNADLTFLKEMVGDARIVALGEATHGTSEFFTIKHRLVQFLAEELGFTIFSIEASMPEAYRLNDYVLTGEGDPEELLEGMYFWTWNTQEVLDMIFWMRDYNASGRGVMQFTGFDMQFPTVAMSEVRDFIGRHDPSYLTDLDKAYSTVAEIFEARPEWGEPSPETEAWKEAAVQVLGHLERNQSSYSDATPSEIAWALQNARIVLQGAEASGGEVSRDESMAENVMWILEQNPDAKAVLWAHNGHVKEEGNSWRGMGWFLAERYGDAYLSLGFSFYEGEYKARVGGIDGELKTNTADPAPAESVGRVFHATELPLFALDLRPALQEPDAAWLTRPQPFRMAGSVALDNERDFYPTALTEDYDLMIFVDQMTATQLLQ